MKVKELIKILDEHPPNSKVVLSFYINGVLHEVERIDDIHFTYNNTVYLFEKEPIRRASERR